MGRRKRVIELVFYIALFVFGAIFLLGRCSAPNVAPDAPSPVPTNAAEYTQEARPIP